ncbi:structural maintenance of chromosomes protein 3-like isoform X2 [Populus alba]|uniref:structural maintenance of chromosomes protein 3-like isoform X2 n=1 Tax=Populus alba TaxID=43335 RepID=UPI003CC6E111
MVTIMMEKTLKNSCFMRQKITSRNEIKQIITIVLYLDERLKERDEEKEEVRKYQQLNKQRKCLEHIIYDTELHDARQKLLELKYTRRGMLAADKEENKYNQTGSFSARLLGLVQVTLT